MKIKYSNKIFFVIFLVVFFIVGSYFSINTGLSLDEWQEQRNWEYNVALVKSIIFQTELEPIFKNYGDKFYGVGFQIISQPIQFFLSDFILKSQDITNFGAHLISKHFVVFIFFFISGFFVYLIIIKITKDLLISLIGTALYLLYPYLLGHGLFNPKDIPFLSLWLICTFVSTNIITNLSDDLNIKYKDLILISFLSAFLLSIRVTGVLIFVQYLFSSIIFLNIVKVNINFFFKKTYLKIFLFVFLTLFFTYLLHPVYWKNPFLFIEAINFMRDHFNNVCTLTLGKCMFSNNLDPIYIPAWLAVKLPLMILIGLLLLPFTERKIFVDKSSSIVFGTLLSSSFFIPIILIMIQANLYDEVRQILFLLPLIFIIGLISLYIFSKKIFYLLSIFTACIFFIENIKIYPYQYAWFNTPSRVFNLSKNFELDYWGLSGRDLANNVSELNKNETKKPCILASPPWLIRPFLDPKHYSCHGLLQEVDAGFDRPFWAILNVRNLKKGDLFKCNLVYKTSFNLLFSNEEIITGKIMKCT